MPEKKKPKVIIDKKYRAPPGTKVSKRPKEKKPEIKKYLKSVDGRVVKIKLKEAIHSIDKFCKIDTKSKIVKDSVVVQTMRYMELLKELKNHARKA